MNEKARNLWLILAKYCYCLNRAYFANEIDGVSWHILLMVCEILDTLENLLKGVNKWRFMGSDNNANCG
jgi:hypothetical protein